MNTIVLNDNTQIEAHEMLGIGAIKTVVENVAAIQTLKDNLTSENLSKVVIKNDAALEIGEYTDLVLNTTWTIKWADTGIEVGFGLHEKTDMERIMETMADHDAAIGDMGEAISELAGGAE